MTNRKWIGILAAGAVFCLLSGAPSTAAVVNPGDTISFSSAPHRDTGFAGGAFKVTDATSGSGWYSFCLEYNEYISFGPAYTVETVVPYATAGGVGGGTGGRDYISSQTAYLYSLYATGGLGFTDDGSKEQQTALQKVFWWLEGEIPTKPTDPLSLGYFGLIEGIQEDGQLYGVLVVNPLTLAGVPSQSQLVYVPEPGAFLLLGSGLLGLIGYRRKRRVE